MKTIEDIMYEQPLQFCKESDADYFRRIAKIWLGELREAEQATYEYLLEEARNDLIYRTMYLSQGAVLAFIDNKLLEPFTFPVKKETKK